jgi:hypothetical protein
VQVIWTCKHFDVGAAICTLVVLLLLPLSLAMDTVSLITMMAVAALVAWRQLQQQRGRWWTTNGRKSGRQQEL